MSVEAFGIEKEFLKDLLREVEEGRAQLPEFQRGWVWPDRNIASLLASISLGYPAGTIMMLRTGGEVRFKRRPVEGATPPEDAVPNRLILDGQQRLTSLFQALRLGAPVRTQDIRKRAVSGWFYIDIGAALDPQGDREDAIRFLPADRIVRNFRGESTEDYSTPAREFESLMFPLSLVFDSDEWFENYQDFWDYDRDRTRQFTAFRREVLQHFNTYQLPVIELGQSTPRQAVCQVFEKVNTGGVTLTVFELLTATFAAEEFDLRQHWEKQCRAAWAGPEYRILQDVANTDFLQAVTLLATMARRDAAAARGENDEERLPRIGCKRVDMLGLTLTEYTTRAPMVVAGLKAAAKFLHREYVYDTRFLPYGAQLIPLAAIFAVLGRDAEPAGAQDKLARWFWCGVFGELYGGTTETRFARDVPDVVAWIRGTGGEPRTVHDAQFASGRLQTLRTRGSAAYKGIYALLLREGAVDWRTGEAATVTDYFDDAMDIHHIFPKAWCETHRIPPSLYNSIINKTPLTARTNRVVGGRAPSDYLSRLSNSAVVPIDVISKYIRTHLADPSFMQVDDFPGFYAARRATLLDRIGVAMGKPIADLADLAETLDDDADDQ